MSIQALACARWKTASATCCSSSRQRRGTKLRTVLIQPDRDAIAGELLRYGDGQADVIDTLPMYPDVHREVVRLLAEIPRSTLLPVLLPLRAEIGRAGWDSPGRHARTNRGNV